MIIKKLRLKNFKAFNDSEISFKKITLLAGANSSGKSTILNSIASIVQSSESDIFPFPFAFSNIGKYVHVGGFNDIKNNSCDDDFFGVGVDVDVLRKNGDPDSVELYGEYRYSFKNNNNVISINKLSVKNIVGRIDVEWQEKTDRYKVDSSLNSKAKKETDIVMSILKDRMEHSFDGETKKRKKSLEEILNKAKISGQVSTNYIKKDSELISGIKNDFAGRIVYDNNISFLKLFYSYVKYIEPVRPNPSRLYFLNSGDFSGVTNYTYQKLIHWQNNYLSKFDKVISDLVFIGVAKNIQIESLKDDLIEVKVSVNGGKPVNLSDVGFGVSQILPVVVAVNESKNHGTLLVNQPEVHLHPSAQALLANYFLKESESKNFIIETHSEYLINRFRLLVAEGKLQKDDISIVYIDSDSITGDAKVHVISVDKYGAIVGAPESFFDTYFLDSHALVMASFDE